MPETKYDFNYWFDEMFLPSLYRQKKNQRNYLTKKQADVCKKKFSPSPVVSSAYRYFYKGTTIFMNKDGAVYSLKWKPDFILPE